MRDREGMIRELKASLGSFGWEIIGDKPVPTCKKKFGANIFNLSPYIMLVDNQPEEPIIWMNPFTSGFEMRMRVDISSLNLNPGQIEELRAASGCYAQIFEEYYPEHRR